MYPWSVSVREADAKSGAPKGKKGGAKAEDIMDRDEARLAVDAGLAYLRRFLNLEELISALLT